ncbi:MAG: hypothetical protein ACYCPQ_06595 [Elusimicrobiota bacterium]
MEQARSGSPYDKAGVAALDGALDKIQSQNKNLLQSLAELNALVSQLEALPFSAAH